MRADITLLGTKHRQVSWLGGCTPRHLTFGTRKTCSRRPKKSIKSVGRSVARSVGLSVCQSVSKSVSCCFFSRVKHRGLHHWQKQCSIYLLFTLQIIIKPQILQKPQEAVAGEWHLTVLYILFRYQSFRKLSWKIYIKSTKHFKTKTLILTSYFDLLCLLDKSCFEMAGFLL